MLSSAIDLPFSLYRSFVIEERFGFNKMTLRLFAIDLAKGALLGAAIGLPVLLAVLVAALAGSAGVLPSARWLAPQLAVAWSG